MTQPNAPDEIAQALRCLNRAAEALVAAGNTAKALGCLQAAFLAAPDNPQAHDNLGYLLHMVGRHTEALDIVRRGLALNPRLQALHHTHGRILVSLEDKPGAVAAYRRAIELDPACAPSHFNLGLLLFSLGRWFEAWREYEWRFALNPALGKFRARFDQPHWQGESLKGKTILLYCEQGLGDAIQFIRYAAHLKEVGARVLVEVPEELVRLFSHQPYIDQVIPRNPNLDLKPELPTHDYVVSLCSLPHLCGLLFPEGPYLLAPKQGPLLEAVAGKRVSLTWAGASLHPYDCDRSIPLEAFAELLRMEGVEWYVLQKGSLKRSCPSGEVDLGKSRATLDRLHDLEHRLEDFWTTAGLAQEMDLIVTVDTAVAHLAGALGKPTWLLLPYVHDWRWPAEGERTPWYPSMHISRQSSARDWGEVLTQVKIALEEWLRERREGEESC